MTDKKPAQTPKVATPKPAAPTKNPKSEVETPNPHEKAHVPDGVDVNREKNTDTPYIPKSETPRVPDAPSAPKAKVTYVTTTRVKHDGYTYEKGMKFPYEVKDLIKSGAVVEA